MSRNPNEGESSRDKTIFTLMPELANIEPRLTPAEGEKIAERIARALDSAQNRSFIEHRLLKEMNTDLTGDRLYFRQVRLRSVISAKFTLKGNLLTVEVNASKTTKIYKIIIDRSDGSSTPSETEIGPQA